MSSLNERLEILSSCIDYRNLTSASQNVGLSQPQLSRIVKKIEDELGFLILDRSSPRHSSWTPQARAVIEIYRRSRSALKSELEAYLDGVLQKAVRIGCLEGLMDLGVEASHKLLKNSHIEEVTLDLYDLNQLEAKFLSTDLDFAFTSRTPGNKKLNYEKIIGHQILKKEKDQLSDFRLLSSYEKLSKQKKEKSSNTLISNSLEVRKCFHKKFGGEVLLPSKVMEKKTKKSVPVVLIGQDQVSKKIWSVIAS